jgi:hypothetical protein
VEGGTTDAAENSRIEINRLTTYYVDFVRTYHIYIDGLYAGGVRDGAAAEFPVVAGFHDVFVRID